MKTEIYQERLEELLQDPQVLIKLVEVMGSLSRFEGSSNIIPNKAILLNTLAIQESKSSNEIESIITTSDEIYKTLASKNAYYGNAKEIINYNKAVSKTTDLLKKRPIITSKMIIDIQAILEPSKSELRKGQVYLKNENERVIYTPPPAQKVPQLLTQCTDFLNFNLSKNQATTILTAIMGHHFFESIHPFNDGNGRTGRILIIATLLNGNIISQPNIFVSRYINNNKTQYYTLIQKIRDNDVIDN